jgi:hypothetical protein
MAEPRVLAATGRSRARLALIVALCVPLSAIAIRAAGDPCSRWTVNGYRVGLTKAQAMKLRPLGAADEGLQAASGIPVEAYSVDLPDGSVGTASFLQKDGLLISWTRSIAFSMHSQVFSQLRDTLGAPELQALGSSVWVSRECDARIELANDGERSWISLMSYRAYKLHAKSVLE